MRIEVNFHNHLCRKTAEKSSKKVPNLRYILLVSSGRTNLFKKPIMQFSGRQRGRPQKNMKLFGFYANFSDKTPPREDSKNSTDAP